jgi:uncharacterized protein (TIGR03435 family)
MERRVRLWLLACGVFVCLAVPATAQVSAEKDAHLEFEVASVKPDKTNDGVLGACRGVDSSYTSLPPWAPDAAAVAPPLGRCVITGARIGHLVSIAWGLPMRLIEGEPNWGEGSDRFSIEAKAEEPTKATVAQLLVMLQTLLIDRFQLRFHRQSVEQPGFALVVGKNGPKMKPAKGEDVVVSIGDHIKPAPDRGKLTAGKVSIARLVETLSFIRWSPVVDKTGLAGEYDFTLNWDEDEGPTLRTAVEEQLGLKLEPQKVPVSLFVIESAHKPSPN